MAESSDHEDPSSTATLKYQCKKLEREEVQKRTFLRWINSQLSRANKKTISEVNFVEEIKDGSLLLALIQILTGVYVKPEIGVMRVHHLNNVDQAIRFLEKQYNIKLVNICSDDIVNGNIKLILGLLWTLILHWQVNDVLKVTISDKPQSNLEKTLLEWCRVSTIGYPKINIVNFSSSFCDGFVFCALFHHYAPTDFNYEDLINLNAVSRLKFAFDFGEKKFGIEKILDPDDVAIDQPDKKSILIYIICCYQILNPKIAKKHQNSSVSDEATPPKVIFRPSPERKMVNIGSEGIAVSKIAKGNENTNLSRTGESSSNPTSSKSNPTSSNVVGDFQSSMESVLVWLLEAKEAISGLPSISNDVQIVKEQFQDHEDFMVKLTERQMEIGSVMQSGNDLLTDPSVSKNEQKQVESQMLLLNKEWEELRVAAMARQSRLQATLTNLQQQQLNNLESWLHKMEAIISENSKKNKSCENVEEELRLHKILQDEVESQQHQVNALQNMVVVVDENNGDDSTYSALEKQLEDLGERWGEVCRWVEGRWVTLQSVLRKLKLFDEKKECFSKWVLVANNNLDSCGNNLNNMDDLAKRIQILKALELDVETYMLHFEELNIIGSELELNLVNDQSAIANINDQLQSLKTKWDATMVRMEEDSNKIINSGVTIEELRQPDGSYILNIKKQGVANFKTITVPTQVVTTTSINNSASINNIEDNRSLNPLILNTHTTKITTTTIGNATTSSMILNSSSNAQYNAASLSTIGVLPSSSYTIANSKNTSDDSSIFTHVVTTSTVTTNKVTTQYPKEIVSPITSKEKLEFLSGYMAVGPVQDSNGEKVLINNTDLPKNTLNDDVRFDASRKNEDSPLKTNENGVTTEVNETKNELVCDEKVCNDILATTGYKVEKAREIENIKVWEEKEIVEKPLEKNPYLEKDIVDGVEKAVNSFSKEPLDLETHKKWQLSLDELRSFLRSTRTDLSQDPIHEYVDISKKKKVPTATLR